MDHKLEIRGSQIVFSFRRNMDIRKRVFEFEDGLKDEFTLPFNTLAIPDEVDPNIPRFESKSKSGKSKLHVSQNRVTLATTYDNAFKFDYTQVEKYIDNKCKFISPLVAQEKMNFVAFVLELGAYFDDEKELNRFLKEHTGAKAITDGCKDFSILYSNEYKTDYYLNVKCSKFTEKELRIDAKTNTLRPSGKQKQGVSVILDINSKPFYERYKKYDLSLYEKMKQKVFDIINKKSVQAFLKGDI